MSTRTPGSTTATRTPTDELDLGSSPEASPSVTVFLPAAMTPEPSPASPGGLRYDPNGPDRDCNDFATQAEAQAFFVAAGGPTRDRHRLDGDKDGVACEDLP
jgi:micrococcal nuclease